MAGKTAPANVAHRHSQALSNFQAGVFKGNKIIDSTIHRSDGIRGQRFNNSIKQFLIAYGTTWLGLGAVPALLLSPPKATPRPTALATPAIASSPT